MKYLVKFSGSFGFIKPWSAIRDNKTKSNFYLTPSILMGIERKLFPDLSKEKINGLSKIERYRLSFDNVSFQQESAKSINYKKNISKLNKKIKYFSGNTSIIERGVLINPVLYLMFSSVEDAINAKSQHICLCRNEDVLIPDEEIIVLNNENEFDDEYNYPGYESFPCSSDDYLSIYCGYNKYTDKKQHITLKIIGVPSNINV